tara:strand:+ start:90 stop:725 length:636 start_codon:yes stop_codon:yes gene_type:complete
MFERQRPIYWKDLTSPGRFLGSVDILQPPWTGRLSNSNTQEIWSKAFDKAFPLLAYFDSLDTFVIPYSLLAPESDSFKNFNVPYTVDLVFEGNLAELDTISEDDKLKDKMIDVWEDYDIYLLRVKGGDIYLGQKLPEMPDDPRLSNADVFRINHWWGEIIPNYEDNKRYQLDRVNSDLMDFTIFDGWGANDVEIYRLRPKELATLNYPRGL